MSLIAGIWETLRPSLFLHTLLEKSLGLGRVTTSAGHTIGGCQIRVVARHAFRHDMVRGDISILPHAMDYQILVNSKRERLTNVDIVKRLGQVIHRVVVDPQLRYQRILVVRQCLGRCEIGGRNARIVGLAGLVRLEIRGRIFVEWVDQLRQLRLGAIVVGVRHKGDIRAMGLRLDLEWTIAT